MNKKNNNIVAASALVAASLLSSHATAAPILPGTLSSYSTVAQTLVLGMSPLAASFGQTFGDRIAIGWAQASRLLDQRVTFDTVALLPIDKTLSTSVVAPAPKQSPSKRTATQTDDVFGSIAIPLQEAGVR
ncbi:MAG: hypothetical protein KL839_16345 [Rhizobium sp.]|nr:hypothetical protein [Rhizobium sp.]